MADIDSLRQIIAGHEAVIAAATARVQSLVDSIGSSREQNALLQFRVDSLLAIQPLVRVAEPHQYGISPGMVIGWGVTAAGIIAAAILAVRGWRKNADTARKSQEDRRVIEETWRRTRLIDRIRSSLESVRAIGRSTVKKDKTHAINPEMMHALIVEWQRYDRLSDDLGLLDAPVIQEQVDVILDHARTIGEKVMEDERRFIATRDQLGMVTGSGIMVNASIQEGIERKRQELLDLIRDMIPRVEDVLAKFNAKFPAAQSHVERTVVEENEPTPPGSTQ